MCMVLLVRIALRKRNLAVECAESMCEFLRLQNRHVVPNLDVSEDDINQALETGDEVSQSIASYLL